MAHSYDEKLLDAIYAAGVDNWDGYDIAMEDVVDRDDPSEVLAALFAAGVDCWEGFGEVNV